MKYESIIAYTPLNPCNSFNSYNTIDICLSIILIYSRLLSITYHLSTVLFYILSIPLAFIHTARILYIYQLTI